MPTLWLRITLRASSMGPWMPCRIITSPIFADRSPSTLLPSGAVLGAACRIAPSKLIFRRCITFTYPAAALTLVLVRWWCSRGLAGNQMHQVRDQGRSPRFATPHHSRCAEIDESGMGAARAVVQIWPPSVHGQSTTCGGQRI